MLLLFLLSSGQVLGLCKAPFQSGNPSCARKTKNAHDSLNYLLQDIQSPESSTTTTVSWGDARWWAENKKRTMKTEMYRIREGANKD